MKAGDNDGDLDLSWLFYQVVPYFRAHVCRKDRVACYGPNLGRQYLKTRPSKPLVGRSGER